jgi:RNA polymerase sigma-70 factor (sigma-E family)
LDEDRRRAFDDLVDARSTSLLQTAFAKTWFRWKRLNDPQAGEAYVRQVMFTTYAKWYRRKWRGEISTGHLPDTDATRDEYAGVDDRDRLQRALAELSPKARAVIVMRFYEDRTEAQVAEVLGCSIGTVKSTAHRGLAKLREAASLAPDPTQQKRALPDNVVELHRKEKSA